MHGFIISCSTIKMATEILLTLYKGITFKVSLLEVANSKYITFIVLGLYSWLYYTYKQI